MKLPYDSSTVRLNKSLSVSDVCRDSYESGWNNLPFVPANQERKSL